MVGTEKPGSVALVWDDQLLSYDFGSAHPFTPLRLRLTVDLLREIGLLDDPDVTVLPPRPATEAELTAVHDPEYVRAVQACAEAGPDLRHGLGTDDNPVFPQMHHAANLVAGGAVVAAEAVWSGRHRHAVHLAGGLHHAMPDRASGFCIYNDLAVGIRWLLDHGAERVAYVDVDVHHGDGVEAAFWDDPRVLTISLHESGATQFPGTGWPEDVGGDDARYRAVNCALPVGVTDGPWLRAFDAVVPPLLRAFKPTVLVTQMGCDTHADDPLGHLSLSLDAQAAAYRRLHELAHEVSDGRWIVAGGGGYAAAQVVPVTWTRLVAEVVHQGIAGSAAAVPERWRATVERMTGVPVPARFGVAPSAAAQPWSAGHDPDDPVDDAILATRTAVFPAYGLDPKAD